MGRPHGRDEIVAAVVGAATDLFAECGPAAVSLRDLAQAAGVTLSQIHRHIGNKEDLIKAVLAAELASTGGQTPGGEDLDLATFLKTLFLLDQPALRTRLQARIILDGYDLPALQDRYPGIELGIELLARDLPDDQARVRAALLSSFFAGWHLLGPAYLRVTGGHDTTPDRFAEIVAPIFDAIATAPPGPS